jgi:hypothetical protein
MELIKNYFIKQDILKESLLLEYYYSESNNKFTWVARPGLFTNLDLKKNPFFKIYFTGVKNYQHIFNKHKNSYFDCKDHFLSQNHQGTFVSINSYLKKRLNLYEIEIEMTFLLGSIKFQFDNFFIEILNTEYIKKEENYIYINAETKEEINFYKPFGEIKE